MKIPLQSKSALAKEFIYKSHLSYFLILSFLFLVSLLIIVAPYTSLRLSLYVLMYGSTIRPPTFRLIIPSTDDVERKLLTSFKSALETNIRVRLKEIVSEKNSNPKEMLEKNKGDLALVPIALCEHNLTRQYALARGDEKKVFIFTTKNHEITEFSHLINKKIGFYGDIETGIYITKKLIQFYNLSLVPELKTETIRDIDKTFSSGELDAIVWVDYDKSTELQFFLDKPWYKIVTIQKSELFTKTTQGVKTSLIFDPTVYGKQLQTVSLPTVLLCSNNISAKFIPFLLETWLTTLTALHPHLESLDTSLFKPPIYLNTHPIVTIYFDKDKPLTGETLFLLCTALLGLLVFSFSLRKMMNILIHKRRKNIWDDLEKYQNELINIKNQLCKSPTHQNTLLAIKKIKLIHTWIIQHLKNKPTNIKLFLPILNQLSFSLIEFNERFFEKLCKENDPEKFKQTIEEKQESGTIKKTSNPNVLETAYTTSNSQHSPLLDSQLNLFGEEQNSTFDTEKIENKGK